MPHTTPRDLNFLSTDKDWAEVVLSITRLLVLETRPCDEPGGQQTTELWLSPDWRYLTLAAPGRVQLLSAQIIRQTFTWSAVSWDHNRKTLPRLPPPTD